MIDKERLLAEIDQLTANLKNSETHCYRIGGAIEALKQLLTICEQDDRAREVPPEKVSRPRKSKKTQ